MARIEFMSSVKCMKPPAFAWHVNLQRYKSIGQPLEVKWRGYQMPHHWWLHCATKPSTTFTEKKTDGLFRTWAFVCGPETSTWHFVSVLWRKLKISPSYETWSTKCPFSMRQSIHWFGNSTALRLQNWVPKGPTCCKSLYFIHWSTTLAHLNLCCSSSSARSANRLLMLFNAKHLALHQSGWTGI